MKARMAAAEHVGNGFPDFPGVAGFFSKRLFNPGHPDIKKGPVKGNIGSVIKFSCSTARSPDNRFICRPCQLVRQPVHPADHGAEKIQGAPAVPVKGAHQFQGLAGGLCLRRVAGKCPADIGSCLLPHLFLQCQAHLGKSILQKCFFHKGVMKKKRAAAIVFASVALESVLICYPIIGGIHFSEKINKWGKITFSHGKIISYQGVGEKKSGIDLQGIPVCHAGNDIACGTFYTVFA